MSEGAMQMHKECNFVKKSSEKKMEKEDIVRTVDCLRGRLLVERAASRNAQGEAEQLGNKLIELKDLLNQEEKSRKRAEKKLRFLMKKLESINISDESQHSVLLDKSDISSISSTTSSTIKEQQHCSISLTKGTSIEVQNVDRNATVEDSISFDLSEKSSSKMDLQSDIYYGSVNSSADEGLNKEDDQDSDSQIDSSLALVLVGSPKNNRIDPEVLDATVKEVLDVLRRAKEQLQSSIERRRTNVIRVG